MDLVTKFVFLGDDRNIMQVKGELVFKIFKLLNVSFFVLLCASKFSV